MHDPIPDNDPSVYKTLLESTKAIPWRIDWKTLQFSYIGPQIEKLLGWAPSSWVSVDDWAARMHPEDREWVVDFCVSQSQSGKDHEADYRALTSKGDYVWIRDVVHVVRKDGEVEALVGFMFDISERKKTEEALLELQKELEALSYTDSLVGIPNRRMFDSVLAVEWETNRRSRSPLSMIFLDIDFFKQYNDHYGHVQGDECLRQFANCLQKAATRSRDFFARYGGEEFVFILPETNNDAAVTVAERCQKLLANAHIPHAKSAISDRLTASFGVGTIHPSNDIDATRFIAEVDRLLYQAKQSGRNQIMANNCTSNILLIS